jgi:hypothetical protein
MPDAILHERSLSDADKLAYLEVLSFAWESIGSDCTAAHRTMADRLGWSVSKLKRALRKLEEAGLIEHEERPGRTSRYRPTLVTDDPDQEPPRSPMIQVPRSLVTYESDELKTEEAGRSRRSGGDHVEAATQPTTTMTTSHPLDVEEEAEEMLVCWTDHVVGRLGRAPNQTLDRARALAAEGIDSWEFDAVLRRALEHGDEFTQRNWLRRFPSLQCFESTSAALGALPRVRCCGCGEDIILTAEQDRVRRKREAHEEGGYEPGLCADCRTAYRRQEQEYREQREREAREERERHGPVVECWINGCNRRFYQDDPNQRECPSCRARLDSIDRDALDEIPFGEPERNPWEVDR